MLNRTQSADKTFHLLKEKSSQIRLLMLTGINVLYMSGRFSLKSLLSLNSRSGNAQESYISLAQRVWEYKCFRELPAQMNLENLEDGTELGQSLIKQGAKHHKKSYELFSNVTLNYMEKSNIKNEIRESQIDGPKARLSNNQILK